MELTDLPRVVEKIEAPDFSRASPYGQRPAVFVSDVVARAAACFGRMQLTAADISQSLARV